MTTLNVENIKYSLYQKAEKLWWISLAGWLLAVATSVFSIFVEEKIALVICGLLSLVVPFVVVWLREIASEYSFKADKCRRLILYSDGLGDKPSEKELLTVKGYSIGEKIDSAYYDPPYYDSPLPPGPARLLDIISESAFFTKELSKKVDARLTVVLVVTLFILVVLGFSSKFWLGFLELSKESFVDFIEAFTIFVVSLVAGDIYLLKTKYSKLSIESDRTLNASIKLKNDKEISVHNVINIASDYDAGVQNCPPIPSFIYKQYINELNDIYKDSIK